MGKLRRWLWRRLMLLQHSASSPRKRQLHIYGDPSWPGKGCPDNHHFQFYYSRGPESKVSCKKCWPSILINQRPHFLIADPQDAADDYTDSCINDMNDDESEHAIRDGQPGIHTAAHRCSSSSVGLKLCLKPNKAMITEHNYPVYPDRHDRIDKGHLCRSFSQGHGHHDHCLERQLYNKLSTVHHGGHDRQLQLRRSHSCSKPSPISGTTNHCGSSHGGKQRRDHSTVVMKGYVAVYVGEEEDSLQRFLVPVSYLSHPAFQELLHRAEREFGFAQKAGLTIPCGLPEFYQTVREIHHHQDQEHSTQLHCIPFDNVVMGRSLSYSRL